MSEVKYYDATPEGESRVFEMVMGTDFDRVTAENSGLQALLTVADERADVLKQAMHALSALIGLPINGPQASQDALLTIIWDALGEEDAALKQAEGGGDE